MQKLRKEEMHNDKTPERRETPSQKTVVDFDKSSDKCLKSIVFI